jgi:UDP-glucuronate decarboxylase
MRILVTGGTGFIGSHLCKKLLNEGHYIICLDNNFTGKMENIASIKNHPNFEFIRHDITQPILLEVDQIYHLACPASPKAYQYNPIKTIKTNILGTLNALGIAKRVKATILLTSTSEVYGDPTINPQVEEYWGNVNPIGIRSCYDEGKRVAETLMMEYNRSNQTQIRIARIFNTYGPNMDKDDGRVVSNFINQAINQQDITIYGTGDQTRSFCYVDDTVEALIKLMNQNETNGPINIGNPYEMTMNELAQKILTLMPYSSSKIIYEQLPNDDPRQRKPDISKAKEYLDWTPSTKLEDGLNKTIKYFLDIY